MTRADDVIDNIDHALHDWDTSPDAMRWTPESPLRRPELTPAQIEALTRTFNTVGAAFARGMKQLAKTFQQAGRAYAKFAHRVMEHDRVRCRVCRPYSNPRLLALGAEYHRRQKRRRRS